MRYCIELQEGYERYQLVANLTANLDAPGVLTHHLYGVGVDTPQAFIYSSDNDFDTQPQKTFGNGKSSYNNGYRNIFLFLVMQGLNPIFLIVVNVQLQRVMSFRKYFPLCESCRGMVP